MPHQITALIVPGPCDGDAARDWDVEPRPLDAGLSLVPVSHYYTAYRQARLGVATALDVPPDFPATFPREGVVLDLAAALTGAAGRAPTFALVQTEYFGGIGDQWACAFVGGRRVPGAADVDAALRVLGVRARDGLDEFDTVGLGRHRSPPDALDRYVALCDDLGA